jgi:hypothetical protein
MTRRSERKHIVPATKFSSATSSPKQSTRMLLPKHTLLWSPPVL